MFPFVFVSRWSPFLRHCFSFSWWPSSLLAAPSCQAHRGAPLLWPSRPHTYASEPPSVDIPNPCWQICTQHDKLITDGCRCAGPHDNVVCEQNGMYGRLCSCWSLNTHQKHFMLAKPVLSAAISQLCQQQTLAEDWLGSPERLPLGISNSAVNSKIALSDASPSTSQGHAQAF